MKRILSIASLVLSFVITVNSQDFEISGTVKDDIGEAMYGVNIFIPGTSTGTSTDFDGKFKLLVPQGTQIVQVSYIGYLDEKLDVGSGTRTFNINMKEDAIGLDQVVVSASKRRERILDAPASVSVLTAEKLERDVPLTPVDHLRKTAGVDIMETGIVSSNVNIRGFNNIFSGAVLTMVDNRIGRVPSLRVNAYQMIPNNPEDIEKIEVIRGPGSALYGPNAADGVIHMITKSPLDQEEKFETTLSFTGGSRSIWKPSIRHSGKISEKFGYKVSGGYMSGLDWTYFEPAEPAIGDTLIFGSVRDGEVFVPDSPAVVRLFTRDFKVEKISGDARIDYKFNNDIDITMNGGFTRATNIELTGLGAAQAKDWVYSYGQARFRWKELFIQYFINSSNAGETYLIPYGVEDSTTHNIQRLIDKSKLHALQIQHSYNKVNKLSLIYGIDALFTRPETEGTINGRFDNDDGIDQIGGYVQAEYDVIDKLTLVGAARVDYQSPGNETVVSPRAAIVYKPTPRHTVRGTYNRAFSSPTSLNLFLDLSNGQHPVHGFNIRGIGNPDGYDYLIGDDSQPQYLNLWTYNAVGPQYQNLTDMSSNPFFFQNLQNVMVSLFIEASGQEPFVVTGLVNSLFAGIGGDTGTIVNAGLTAFNFLNVLDDTTGNPSNILWNGNGDVSSLDNLNKIESSITQTIEFGYKGVIADKLFLTADVFYTKISNFTSPLTLASPTVGFSPEDLLVAFGPGEPGGILYDNAADAYSFLGNTLDGNPAYGSDIANGTVYDELVFLFQLLNAQVPSGIITPDDDKVNNDAILTYINLGDVDIFGADVSFNYYMEYGQHEMNIGGSGSFVNKGTIPLAGADGGRISLNAPKYKSSLSFTHQLTNIGFGYGLNWRWQDAYFASSAVYVGDVETANFVDLNMNYRPNWSKNTVFNIDVTNILATGSFITEKHQRFPGTP
ncbi:MAG: TonB-dependent receptor, partial [Bacteroidia bacterium]|nr:TonB-dependent receptor [Bacteroidia bacterium]